VLLHVGTGLTVGLTATVTTTVTTTSASLRGAAPCARSCGLNGRVTAVSTATFLAILPSIRRRYIPVVPPVAAQDLRLPTVNIVVPSRRALLYSHDSYGLGHLRRTMLIAESLARRPAIDDVLVVTGSPRSQSFHLPPGIDLVKLPVITKDDRGGYRPRTMRQSLDETVALRSRIIEATVEAFRPDVVLVDHAPVGLGGELLPVLERWAGRRGGPTMVLGLRDIVDHPDRVEQEWERNGVWDVLRTAYDHVLVYGDPTVRTTAMDLRLDERLPCPVTHVGYVTRSAAPRDHRMPDVPQVLVTVGGGGDGHRLLRAYAAFLEGVGPAAGFHSVVVTGPLSSSRRHDEISEALEATGAPVEVLKFTDHHDELLARSSAVIAMAGYNTVCEIITARVPALLVPREAPRVEQFLRATRLRDLGIVELQTVDRLAPELIGDFIGAAVRGERRPTPTDLDLGGIEATSDHIITLLSETPCHESRPVAPVTHSSPDGRGRVGYVLKKFPRLSETFILNELLGLEALGLDVEVHSLHPADPEPRHAALARLRAPVQEVHGRGGEPIERLRVRLERDAGAAAAERVEAFLHRLPARRRPQVLAQALELAATVRARGITHLHAHFMTVAAHTAYVVHLVTGVPFTVTAHAKDIYRDGVDRAVFVEVAAAAASLVTVCVANERHIREHLTDDRARIDVVYNGLPLDALPPPARDRDRGLVLGVGRLVEKKGFEVLVDACRILRDRGRRFECVIVGDGDRRDAIAASIHAADLGGCVRMIGAAPQETVLELMGRARLLAAPCVTGTDGNRDALPTVIIEAIAMGLPVVTTPVGGIPEMVTDGVEGSIVSELDSIALADAIERLLADDDTWTRMAAAGPTTARTRFDQRVTIRSFAALLEGVRSAGGSAEALRPRERPAPAQSVGTGAAVQA
jgi:predicted glycosyltransferase/glycosyltransferase involved in cell wall biosynthesis